MIMNQIAVFIFLWVMIITKTQSDTDSSEDLIDEYYTTTNTTIDKITTQDHKYAQAIIDSDKNAKLMMSIFVYRDKIRRRAISQEVSDINNIIADQTQPARDRGRRRRYWITDAFEPQHNLLMDLCYCLTFDENFVLAGYLRNFFGRKDKTWIAITMVLIKDLNNVKAVYDTYNYVKFKASRKKQKKPFENMLRVWVRGSREPIEKEEIPCEIIKFNVDSLKKEQDDGGWHGNRNQLELILMKKSIKFSRLVIEEYENTIAKKPIEDLINENVKKHDLNKDLAYAYASLACYIKDKHKYIARLLDKYSDGSDSWAAWMICIAVLHPQEWPKIDEVFKKDHKGDSLSTFILQKMTHDKVVAEAIAAIVDPKFKPSTFTEKKDNDGEVQAQTTSP